VGKMLVSGNGVVEGISEGTVVGKGEGTRVGFTVGAGTRDGVSKKVGWFVEKTTGSRVGPVVRAEVGTNDGLYCNENVSNAASRSSLVPPFTDG